MGAPIFLTPLEEGSLALLSRIRDLWEKATPAVRRAYLEGVSAARDSAKLEQVAQLIEANRIEEALRLVDDVAPAISEALEDAYRRTGQATTAALSRARAVRLTFDGVNPRAVAYLQEERLRLIREIAEDQRGAVLRVLADGNARGVPVRDMARGFRDVIGLTEKQATAVVNYRRLLEQNSSEALARALRDGRFDRTVRAAIANERPLTATQINRMVDRYAERYRAYRARVISRTETLRAVHAAEHESIRQALEAAGDDGAGVVRIWRTAQDDRVRDTHADMEGQERGFDEPFESPSGELLMFPGDPEAPPEETIQCRCVVESFIPRLR